MYTVMVAAMGRLVVAVDAIKDNLAYIRRSLNLGNTTNNVQLVHNSIRFISCLKWFKSLIPYFSDIHHTLYPVTYDDNTNILENPGSQKLLDE